MNHFIESSGRKDEPAGKAPGGPGLDGLRVRLDDPAYMSAAVETLARNLCLELMETEYGIADFSRDPFSRTLHLS